MVSARTIASLYALLASLAVLLLVTLMPPMQNADEAAHVMRASQISHGGLLGIPIPDGEFGGIADPAPLTLQKRFAALPGHDEQKVQAAMYAPLAWGTPLPLGFPNTAVNAPFFYLPASVAAWLARTAQVPFPRALVLMRLATGAVTILVATLAIALSGGAALGLFGLLLLPMSLSLSAAVSQDGPMLGCAALAAALFFRLRQPEMHRRKTAYVGLCVLLTALGMARAPYAAFALLALAVPVRRSWRVIALTCILACAVGWSLRSAAYLPVPERPEGIVMPGKQLAALLGHPWRVPVLAWSTLQAHGGLIARSFIGQPGWLDVTLPIVYHCLAWANLALACLLVWRPALARASALPALAIIGGVCGAGLVQYMAWTVVGSPIIEGLQGRYFLPPALLAVGCFAGNASGRRWLNYVVLGFPVISIAVEVHAIVLRYYF